MARSVHGPWRGRSRGADAMLKVKMMCVPMMEVYSLYRGQSAPEDVLAAARAGMPNREALNAQRLLRICISGFFMKRRAMRPARDGTSSRPPNDTKSATTCGMLPTCTPSC